MNQCCNRSSGWLFLGFHVNKIMLIFLPETHTNLHILVSIRSRSSHYEQARAHTHTHKWIKKKQKRSPSRCRELGTGFITKVD